MNDRITLTIHTCEKFSDIWDVSIGLLNKNWNDRNMNTILVTDDESSRSFQNVQLFCAGKGLDMPERTKKLLSTINTEYIFFTLDDYFLVDKIDSNRINKLLDIMDKNKIDYLSFKNHHTTRKVIDSDEKIYELDLNSGEDYIVNLYPGIWRTSFMKKTLEEKKDIWDYEVSLTKYAIEQNSVCCTSKGNQFPILDGVRKGKFLHKSYSFLKKNNLYDGDREIISYLTEIKLFMMDQLKIYLPKPIVIRIKKIMRKFGYKFFSE